MSAAEVIADRLDECADHVPGEDEEHNLGECALEALTEAGFTVVELPKPDCDGNYRPHRGDGPKGATRVIIDPWCATRVAIDDLSRRTSFTPEQARTIAAGLLAAANAAEARS